MRRQVRPAAGDGDDIRMIQPSGILPVACTVKRTADGWVAEQAAVTRTQRRLFEGRVLVPASSVAVA